MRFRVLLAVGVVAVGALAWPTVRPTVRATALMLDLTGEAPTLRRLLPVPRLEVRTHDIDIPARHGAIRARVYLPSDPRLPSTSASTHTLVMFPGVHGGGLDEPRMSALARKFSAMGLTVVAAPLPELRRYIVRARSTDDVEDTIGWIAAQPDLAPAGHVAVVGVSFAGGLALVAAGRPSLAGKIDFIATLGSHGNLPRTMAYLLTSRLPDGSVHPANDYGAVVILLAGAHHLVPPDQVAPLREAITTFLDGSSLDVTDPPGSARLFAQARAMGEALPEPARTVMRWVSDRDIATLGPKLLPYIEELGGDPALSPERSPVTQVPVFLLHGAHDDVIPPTETPLLADYLRAKGNTHVTSLLTPLVGHANVEAAPNAGDIWRIIAFWSGALRILSAP